MARYVIYSCAINCVDLDANCHVQIIVRGPSVTGNEAALGVAGLIREDNTLAYV